MIKNSVVIRWDFENEIGIIKIIDKKNNIVRKYTIRNRDLIKKICDFDFKSKSSQIVLNEEIITLLGVI